MLLIITALGRQSPISATLTDTLPASQATDFSIYLYECCAISRISTPIGALKLLQAPFKMRSLVPVASEHVIASSRHASSRFHSEFISDSIDALASYALFLVLLPEKR